MFSHQGLGGRPRSNTCWRCFLSAVCQRLAVPCLLPKETWKKLCALSLRAMSNSAPLLLMWVSATHRITATVFHVSSFLLCAFEQSNFFVCSLGSGKPWEEYFLTGRPKTEREHSWKVSKIAIIRWRTELASFVSVFYKCFISTGTCWWTMRMITKHTVLSPQKM